MHQNTGFVNLQGSKNFLMQNYKKYFFTMSLPLIFPFRENGPLAFIFWFVVLFLAQKEYIQGIITGNVLFIYKYFKT